MCSHPFFFPATRGLSSVAAREGAFLATVFAATAFSSRPRGDFHMPPSLRLLPCRSRNACLSAGGGSYGSELVEAGEERKGEWEMGKCHRSQGDGE
jgi:hypothetical protein